MEKQNLSIDEKYYQDHKYCPSCQSDRLEVTTAGYCFQPDNNHARCSCGWSGRVHDLISIEEVPL